MEGSEKKIFMDYMDVVIDERQQGSRLKGDMFYLMAEVFDKLDYKDPILFIDFEKAYEFLLRSAMVKAFGILRHVLKKIKARFKEHVELFKDRYRHIQ